MARWMSVFKQMFCVNDSAYIKNIDCKKDTDGLCHVYVDLCPHKRLLNRCPHCGKRCPGYDSRGSDPRYWRHLDCGGVFVWFRYAAPRICCSEHGVVTAAVPWAFAGSRFTKQFDLQVAWLAKYQARSTVQTLMRIDWKTVGRCTERAMSFLDPDADTRRLSGLVRIGVDETSYRKGHKYMTVVVNHDTGEVVWVHDGHGLKVFEKFFDTLTPQQRQSIKYVSADGARWVDDCIKKYVPQAIRCVDPFHVVQWATDSVDKLRTQIWQAMRTDSAKLKQTLKDCTDEDARKKLTTQIKEHATLTRELKGSSYALGKGFENLLPSQHQKLELIANCHPRLYRAYQLKEELRHILKLGKDDVQECLKRWFWKASHCRIEVMKELAKKIKRHTGNIINSVTYGLSNARIEAINNKIKLTVRRSYGFRNLDNMFAFVKLICSSIEIPLPNRPGKKPPKGPI